MVTRIQKTSGESEEFNPEKIRSSLVAAGAEESIATTLTAEIASHPEDFPSTDRIHQRLFERLKQENKRPLAARYNLRRAIIELGPSGYPFEKFTAALLSARGMQTQLNLTMQGECVSHEVDVMASDASGENNDGQNSTYIIENKFHKRPGFKVSVRIPLYVKSRFDDIVAGQGMDKDRSHAWIFTNTKFSKDTIAYAKCKGIFLTGWSYPKGDSLNYWIDKLQIHPLTAMTTLDGKQKKYLVEQGVVLCRHLEEQKHLLQELSLESTQIDAALSEARGICEITKD